MAAILLAASPEPRRIAERVLMRHRLVVVESLAEARTVLAAEPLDMVVCTIAFDDSRMFDLLRLIKATPGWAKVPFIGARMRASLIYPHLAGEALEFTCKTLGGTAFLDITHYPSDPEAQMRNAIESYLPAARP